MRIGRILQRIRSKLRFNYRVMIINVMCLFGIVALGTNTFRVLSVGMQRYKLIVQENVDLTTVQEEEIQLENNLGWYTSLEFIEMQSRDYLNLANEGDSVLVLPDDETIMETTLEQSDSSDLHILPSIDLWVKLLF